MPRRALRRHGQLDAASASLTPPQGLLQHATHHTTMELPRVQLGMMLQLSRVQLRRRSAPRCTDCLAWRCRRPRRRLSTPPHPALLAASWSLPLSDSVAVMRQPGGGAWRPGARTRAPAAARGPAPAPSGQAAACAGDWDCAPPHRAAMALPAACTRRCPCKGVATGGRTSLCLASSQRPPAAPATRRRPLHAVHSPQFGWACGSRFPPAGQGCCRTTSSLDCRLLPAALGGSAQRAAGWGSTLHRCLNIKSREQNLAGEASCELFVFAWGRGVVVSLRSFLAGAENVVLGGPWGVLKVCSE